LGFDSHRKLHFNVEWAFVKDRIIITNVSPTREILIIDKIDHVYGHIAPINEDIEGNLIKSGIMLKHNESCSFSLHQGDLPCSEYSKNTIGCWNDLMFAYTINDVKKVIKLGGCGAERSSFRMVKVIHNIIVPVISSLGIYKAFKYIRNMFHKDNSKKENGKADKKKSDQERQELNDHNLGIGNGTDADDNDPFAVEGSSVLPVPGDGSFVVDTTPVISVVNSSDEDEDEDEDEYEYEEEGGSGSDSDYVSEGDDLFFLDIRDS